MPPGRSTKPPSLISLAVDVEQARGVTALLQQQVSSALTNLSGQMGALQGEQKELGREQKELGKMLGEISATQHAMQSNSDAIARSFTAIERLGEEFYRWREKHEIENRAVADKVHGFRWWLSGLAVAGGAVILLVAYIFNDKVNYAEAERARILQHHDRDMGAVYKRLDRERKP